MARKNLQLFIPLFCSLVSFFCAGQMAPSGGPPDTSPPMILESSPAQRELRVSGRTIVLRFNKYVDRATLQQSLFISPPLGRLSYDWSGTEVEIHYADTLKGGTTYVLTIGTDFKDTRNNRLAASFSLAFSTGDHLDSCRVSGRVVDPKPEGVMVLAYRLDERSGDTLNPAHTLPDYVTQSGVGGNFTLSNMAPGHYRVAAVRNRQKDLLYRAGADDFGVADRDLHLEGQGAEIDDIYFALTREDTLLPFVSSARGIDRHRIAVKLNESPDPESLEAGTMTCVDTVSGIRLPVFDVWYESGTPNVIYLGTAEQESSRAYRLVVSGWRDLAGNPLSPAGSSALVSGSADRDTVRPTIELEGISDSAKNVIWDDTLVIVMNEGILRGPFERSWKVTDSDGKNVPGKLLWRGCSVVWFIPSEEVQPGASLRCSLRLDSLSDFSGNHYGDTVWHRTFRTMDAKMLGSIHGIVLPGRGAASERIQLVSREVSDKGIKPRTLSLTSAGPFVFSNLPEGIYSISAYRDRKGDRRFDFGALFPFRPSDPFAPPRDSLKVRARWPLEGAVVRFP